jgi:S-adenosylmethionine hydrolase
VTTDRPHPVIFFLSDYGTDDEFVGVVHAVLHRLAPQVAVIDLSHQVPPFEVAAGAAMLVRCAPHLGTGVVLAVVDPGVGTGRRAVAIGTGARADDAPHWLVGPDNGLLVPVAQALGGVDRAVDLTGSGGVGGTFDGRDLFAPVAAHLALGGDPGALGPDLDPDHLQVAPPARGHPDPPADDQIGGITATVLWVDRFGNVQLDLRPDHLAAAGLAPGDVVGVAVGRDAVAGRARWVRAFAALDPGELGMLVDANGHIALVCDRAAATCLLGAPGPGDRVRLIPERPAP